MRGVAEGNLFHAESFGALRDALGIDAGRFRVVITYLVRHEWEQNKDQARKSAESHLVSTGNSIRRVADARGIVGLPASSVDDRLFDPALAGSLVGLAEEVMDRSFILERNELCVSLALERVMLQRRPSTRIPSKIRSIGSITWNCPAASWPPVTPEIDSSSARTKPISGPIETVLLSIQISRPKQKLPGCSFLAGSTRHFAS